jgi:hypothetical protein
MFSKEVIKQPVTESSGYSLAGSFTRDLIASKIWLLKELERVQREFSTIYILGSWYGNLSLYLTLESRIHADLIVNVEKDQKMLDTSDKLLQLAHGNNVEPMFEDANTLDYRQLGDQGCVINCSLTDMPGRAWFLNIPMGTLVVMQGRDQDPNRNFDSTQDIIDRFPLSKVLYHGSMRLRDPQTEYTRHMVVGRK